MNDVLPPTCIVCDNVLSPAGYPAGLCSVCYGKLPFRPPDKCFKYLQIDEETEAFPLFTAFYYEDLLREAVRGLKFHERIDFGQMLGDLLSVFWLRTLRICDPETAAYLAEFQVLVPMPLHRKRLRERGYNQCEVIGQQLAWRTDLSVDTGLLYRKKQTKRQSEMGTRDLRLANVKDAFEADSPKAALARNIILLDDVVSTGATVWSAANCLREAGARVLILTLASDQVMGSTEGL